MADQPLPGFIRRLSYVPGSLLGVPVLVHITWLPALALVIAFANRVLDTVPAFRIALSVAAGLLLFGCILIHELAHIAAARRCGLSTSNIILSIFGVIATIEGNPATPLAEAFIAISGPVCSLMLALVCAALAMLPLGTSDMATTWGALARFLGYGNLAVCLFNLVPVEPIDGGRILHALVWKMGKDARRATRLTSMIATFVASFTIASLVSSYLIWHTVMGLTFILPGFAILANARANYLNTSR